MKLKAILLLVVLVLVMVMNDFALSSFFVFVCLNLLHAKVKDLVSNIACFCCLKQGLSYVLHDHCCV